MKTKAPNKPVPTCDVFVNVRVSQKLKDQFTEVAHAQGRNASEAFREAMAEWVGRTAKRA